MALLLCVVVFGWKRNHYSSTFHFFVCRRKDILYPDPRWPMGSLFLGTFGLWAYPLWLSASPAPSTVETYSDRHARSPRDRIVYRVYRSSSNTRFILYSYNICCFEVFFFLLPTTHPKHQLVFSHTTTLKRRALRTSIELICDRYKYRPTYESNQCGWGVRTISYHRYYRT